MWLRKKTLYTLKGIAGLFFYCSSPKVCSVFHVNSHKDTLIKLSMSHLLFSCTFPG